MIAEIYIISGFLGAGKTTLIRKLLKEAFTDERIAIVENDFGEVGVDASLIRAEGAEVAELRAGCICCSLAGDLVKTLRRLIENNKPDKLIIEPSGVGKLSDVAAACADPGFDGIAEVKRKITVVDASRCGAYLENFGEFFSDQIEHADAVLFSHAEENPERTDAARALVESLNARAELFAEPWDDLDAARLLYPATPPRDRDAHCHDHGHVHDEHDRCVHEHECGEHEHDCGEHRHAHGEHPHAHDAHCGEHEHDCGEHEHDCGEHAHGFAEDAFDTVTIRTERAFGSDELRACVLRMEREASGKILRAKGILRGSEGFLSLQYLPGDAKIENCAVEGDALCVIGRGLNGPELAALFGGVL
ncbi:MAG: GTP-binding protein [Clostridiales Family XIII bacterium]|jgi:G3E family GTPase|nr:GTP-binding protein [Clostridiales Family XIII bacterium]